PLRPRPNSSALCPLPFTRPETLFFRIFLKRPKVGSETPDKAHQRARSHRDPDSQERSYGYGVCGGKDRGDPAADAACAGLPLDERPWERVTGTRCSPRTGRRARTTRRLGLAGAISSCPSRARDSGFSSDPLSRL